MTYHSRLHLAGALTTAWLLAACNDATSGDGTTNGVAGTPAVTAGSTATAGKPGAAGTGTAGTGTIGSGVGIAGARAQAGASGSSNTAGTGGSVVAGNGGDADWDAGIGEAGSGGSTAAAGSGGAAGGTASDDGIGGKAPFVADGMPIMAPDSTWTWLPFSETKCRNGTPAGIGVNMASASKRVMIYLEGGGACFDAQTCGANPPEVASQTPGGGGVFDRSNAANPVKDWNFVYVPYCTGDVHMGAKDDGMIDGVTGAQHFVGRTNLKAFLNRLVPTFSDAEQVLLTGVSAGGFGAASNGAYVQWAFGQIPVTMIDDSGPSMSNKYLPTCLTNKYVTSWGLEGSILDDCGSACSASEDYSTQFLEYSAMRAAGRFSGLIESDQDVTIRGFFGIGTNNGANDCMGVLLFTPMSTDDFLAGLLEYREHVKPYPGFSTFYPSDTKHTWLGDNDFYRAEAGGIKLTDWVKNVLDGKPAMHAGH